MKFPATRRALAPSRSRYGISGNGLAKLCGRLNISYPPRSYWARKAGGKKVSQSPLPAIQQGTPAHVTVTPSLSASPMPQPSNEPEAAVA
jgi:hypothetical protein